MPAAVSTIPRMSTSSMAVRTTRKNAKWTARPSLPQGKRLKHNGKCSTRLRGSKRHAPVEVDVDAGSSLCGLAGATSTCWAKPQANEDYKSSVLFGRGCSTATTLSLSRQRANSGRNKKTTAAAKAQKTMTGAICARERPVERDHQQRTQEYRVGDRKQVRLGLRAREHREREDPGQRQRARPADPARILSEIGNHGQSNEKQNESCDTQQALPVEPHCGERRRGARG